MGKAQLEQKRGNILLHNHILASNHVIQIFILSLTVYLAWNKLKDDRENIIFMSPEIIKLFILAILIILLYYRTLNPKCFSIIYSNTLYFSNFDSTYVLYLPFMTSLLFNKSLIRINCLMCINHIYIPMHLRLFFQVILVLMEEQYDSDKLKYIIAIGLNALLCYSLERISDLRSLSRVDCNLFSVLLTNILYLISSDKLFFQILQKCIYAFIMTIIFAYFISFFLDGISQVIRSIIYACISLIIFLKIITSILVINGNNIVPWMIEYIGNNPVHFYILLSWVVSLIILVPTVFLLKSNFSLNTCRKLWHFILLPLLIPSIKIDLDFSKTALSAAIMLFLITEYIRYLKLYPLGEFIDRNLRSFTDVRDNKGPIIISYIYLLIGISLPVLIDNSIVGIVGLGVGDSLASMVGKSYGKHYWPNTKKTLQGTLAFILATTFTCWIFQEYFGFFKNISSQNILLACILSGILEGNSTVNDNLLIPSFMMIIFDLYKN